MGLRLDKPRRERSQSTYSVGSSKRKYSSASCRGFTSSPNSGGSTKKRPALFNSSDVYILRQVATSRNEYDLQQKIDLEIKMREGTSKLLAACKHQTQTLEAAKSLLTSDTRLSEFRTELHSRKTNKAKYKKSTAHLAKASVSEIRIPLLWKDTDIFKNKPDTRKFAVFCLLQIGTEIYDTFLTTVDRTVTDICFDEVFNFNQVPSDFRLKIQLYARLIGDDFSSIPTARKLTQKISNSVSRSFGRKWASMKDDFDTENGPKFYLIASGMLNIRDASDANATHDLNVERIDKHLQLPLFGDFCCRFALQSECQSRETFSGMVQCSVDRKPEMCWASAKNFKISFWPVPDNLQQEPAFVRHTIKQQLPTLIIPVNSSSKVNHQENSIELISGDRRIEIAPLQGLGSTTELFKALIRMRDEFAVWEPISEYQMELVNENEPRPAFMRNRNKSLYDETPIHDLRKRHSKSLSNVSSIDTKYNALSTGTLGRPFRAINNGNNNNTNRQNNNISFRTKENSDNSL